MFRLKYIWLDQEADASPVESTVASQYQDKNVNRVFHAFLSLHSDCIARRKFECERSKLN